MKSMVFQHSNSKRTFTFNFIKKNKIHIYIYLVYKIYKNIIFYNIIFYLGYLQY